MVHFTKRSPFTGKEYTMALPLTPEEFERQFTAWARDGVLIQNAFPTLNADEREFIKTGITPQEWAATFGEDE